MNKTQRAALSREIEHYERMAQETKEAAARKREEASHLEARTAEITEHIELLKAGL